MLKASTFQITKLMLLGAACGTFVAACHGGGDSTSPTADSTALPAGVWHADVDQGPLHSVDMDTRFSIGTAQLRSCAQLPPGACTVNGTVLMQQSGSNITLTAAYLNHTIFATFTGAQYSDGTLRGTMVVSSSSQDNGSTFVTMRRTR